MEWSGPTRAAPGQRTGTRGAGPVRDARRCRGWFGAVVGFGGALGLGATAWAQDGAEIALDTISVEAEQSRATTLIGPPPAAYAGGQVAGGTRLGVLGNRSVFEVPFSVNSFTERLVKDRQAVAIQDIAKYDTSTFAQASRGKYFDSVRIRGLQAPYLFDGLYGPFSRGYAFFFEPYERVEVLKGPAGSLAGVQGIFPGGAINLVPKRATDTPITELTARYLGGEAVGTHLDVGRRFGDGNAFGLRFNGIVQKGDTNVDGQELDRVAGHLAFDYRGETVRLTADLDLLDNTTKGGHPTLSVAQGVAIPRAPRLDRTYGQSWTDYRVGRGLGVVRAEWDVAKDWTIGAASSGQLLYENGRYDGDGSILNGRGDYSVTTGLGDGRTYINWDQYLYLKGKVETGPVTHRVTIDGSAGSERYNFRPFNSFTYTSNLYAPRSVAEPVTLRSPTRKGLTRDRRSVIVADEIGLLEDRVLVTVAGRWTDLDQKRFDLVTGATTQDIRANAFTPVLGLLVKPTSWLSLYGSFAEAIEYGAVAPNNAVNRQTATAPLTSRQYEVGAKADFGRFGLTMAWFDIAKENALLDPTTRIFGVNGEQVHRGVEVQAFGEPVEGVRLLGGVTYIDPTLTKTAGGAFDGNQAPDVPPWRFVASAEVDVPAATGLSVYAAVNFTGDWYLDAANLQKVPGYATVDVGAVYRVKVAGHDATLRVAVENLFDERYWASSAFNGLQFGTPRTLLVSSSVRF